MIISTFFLISSGVALFQYNGYVFKNESKSEVVIKDNPINCPLMFSAQSHNRDSDEEKYLILQLVENPTFNPDKGDACEGNMKNIWTDLTRLEKEIESHSGNIKHFHSISFNIAFFPETSREIQTYFDKSPEKKKLFGELDKLKGRNLFNNEEFDRRIRYLIIDVEEKYWMEIHAPIIEKVLYKYDLKIDGYDSEKHFYCAPRYDLCNSDGGYKGWFKDESLNFQYSGPAFDWLSFKSSVAIEK